MRLNKSKNYRLLSFSFLLVALAVLCIGCKKDDDNQKKDTPKTDTRVGLQFIVDSNMYDPSDFIPAVNQSVLLATTPSITTFSNPLFSIVANRNTTVLNEIFETELSNASNKEWGMESYSFTYMSTSSFGQPILLSGRVTFPNNKDDKVDHEVSTLSIVCHQFPTTINDVPSTNVDASTIRAFYNSAVIQPDYQGFGVDSLIHSFPGFDYITLGKQTEDCVLAALEVMRRHGVHLATNGHSTLWGTSCGATCAIAFARYHEQMSSDDIRRQIRLKSSFIGEGPLNTCEQLFESDRFQTPVASLVLFVTFLKAIPPSFLNGIDPLDFITPYLTTPVKEYNGKLYSYLDYSVWALGYIAPMFNSMKFDDVFANDMRNPQTNRIDYSCAKVQLLYDKLNRLTSLGDYHPLHEMYIAEDSLDKKIIYPSVRNVYEQLRKGTDGTIHRNVHWLEVNANSELIRTLAYGNEHEATAILMLLYYSSVREPSDMASIYNQES